MAYQEFANKPSVSNGDALNPTTQINNPAQGVQDEFELRDGDGRLDGVASGLGCSIDDTEIDIASGRAYVAGKRYSGGASVDFTGKSSDTYFVYIDGADDDGPYKAKTSSPTSGELVLCTVDWNGSDTLSNLDDDAKVLGLQAHDIVVALPGTAAAGVQAVIPVAHDLWVESVRIAMSSNGAGSGATTVDVHLGADGSKGDSIFATQANRPSLAHDAADYTVAVSGMPDGDRKPDAGEHLVIEVDEVAGTPGADLTVLIKARLR
ncbi:MAG: hypothetical protein FJX74_05595 [Armatimonadetes bacterium]|nr:hypothetical protein [Armatimonadota bacterium]